MGTIDIILEYFPWVLLAFGMISFLACELYLGRKLQKLNAEKEQLEKEGELLRAMLDHKEEKEQLDHKEEKEQRMYEFLNQCSRKLRFRECPKGSIRVCSSCHHRYYGDSYAERLREARCPECDEEFIYGKFLDGCRAPIAGWDGMTPRRARP